MPSVVHYEIPADDVERAQKFYGEIFGWKITDEHNMGYFFIDSKGEHGIGGGIMKRMMPEQTTVIYMEVDSVDSYTAKVQEHGGQVIVPKTAIPGFGWFAVCMDTENNAFGLHQEDKEAK